MTGSPRMDPHLNFAGRHSLLDLYLIAYIGDTSLIMRHLHLPPTV